MVTRTLGYLIFAFFLSVSLTLAIDCPNPETIDLGGTTQQVCFNEDGSFCDPTNLYGGECLKGIDVQEETFTPPISQFTDPLKDIQNPLPCGALDAKLTTLKSDVVSDGDCFTAQASDITLDCNNHKIIYATKKAGHAVTVGSKYSNVKITNCIIIQGSELPDSSAIYLEGNAIIQTNQITTYGLNSYGIYLDSVANQIYSNQINIYGYTGTHAIYLDSSKSNNIKNNIISNKGVLKNYGIYLFASSQNTLSGNQISVGESTYDKIQSNEGITLVSSDSNTISSNTLSVNGFLSKGISLTNSKANTIDTNSLTVNGDATVGFYSDKDSQSSQSGNTLKINGKISSGIISLAKQNQIESNTLTMAGDYLTGIYLDSPEQSSVSKNILTLNAESDHINKAIYLSKAKETTLSNNQITASSAKFYGFSASGSQLTFSANTISLIGDDSEAFHIRKNLL